MTKTKDVMVLKAGLSGQMEGFGPFGLDQINQASGYSNCGNDPKMFQLYQRKDE